MNSVRKHTYVPLVNFDSDSNKNSLVTKVVTYSYHRTAESESSYTAAIKTEPLELGGVGAEPCAAGYAGSQYVDVCDLEALSGMFITIRIIVHIA